MESAAGRSRNEQKDAKDLIGRGLRSEEAAMSHVVKYTVSDGEMVLTLEPAEEGGFIVTSPLDPELVTQAETLEKAFANARDAAEALNESRKLFAEQFATTAIGSIA